VQLAEQLDNVVLRRRLVALPGTATTCQMSRRRVRRPSIRLSIRLADGENAGGSGPTDCPAGCTRSRRETAGAVDCGVRPQPAVQVGNTDTGYPREGRLGHVASAQPLPGGNTGPARGTSAPQFNQTRRPCWFDLDLGDGPSMPGRESASGASGQLALDAEHRMAIASLGDRGDLVDDEARTRLVRHSGEQGEPAWPSSDVTDLTSG